ncbi:hypothetical protein VTK56DRAFT_4705 [Thermocarpiscus australiensis]
MTTDHSYEAMAGFYTRLRPQSPHPPFVPGTQSQRLGRRTLIAFSNCFSSGAAQAEPSTEMEMFLTFSCQTTLRSPDCVLPWILSFGMRSEDRHSAISAHHAALFNSPAIAEHWQVAPMAGFKCTPPSSRVAGCLPGPNSAACSCPGTEQPSEDDPHWYGTVHAKPHAALPAGLSSPHFAAAATRPRTGSSSSVGRNNQRLSNGPVTRYIRVH